MTKWGMLIDLKRCAGCGACIVACQLQNNQSPGVSWGKLDKLEWGEEPGSCGRAYLPHACMHCDDPQCVAVCPTGASQKADDGVVLVDYDACIACGSCITACPYGARAVNKAEGNYFDEAEQAPYEAYGVQREHVVEKCIFCHDRITEGLPTACVLNCPAHARFFGDLDDPESDVSKRIAKDDAVRIDETSFYYVPATGMDEDLLPFAAKAEFAATGPQNPQGPQGSKAAPGIDPVVATVGVAAVAAVGAGIGVGVKKSRDKKKAEAKAAAAPTTPANDDDAKND